MPRLCCANRLACTWHRREVGAIYTGDLAVQAALLASIPILAAMLPGDALNCVYSGASQLKPVDVIERVRQGLQWPTTCRHWSFAAHRRCRC